MARAAVLGDPLRIYGYGLAGALLCPASDRREALTVWQSLPDDVSVVVLTSKAATWLADEIGLRPDLLPVVLPEPGWSTAQQRAEPESAGRTA